MMIQTHLDTATVGVASGHLHRLDGEVCRREANQKPHVKGVESQTVSSVFWDLLTVLIRHASSGQPSPGADISLIGGVTVVVASKRLGVLLPVDPPWWCLNGTHLPPQCAGIRLIRPSRRHVCRAFWLVSVPQRTAPRIKKVLVVDVYSEFCCTVRSARLPRTTYSSPVSARCTCLCLLLVR